MHNQAKEVLCDLYEVIPDKGWRISKKPPLIDRSGYADADGQPLVQLRIKNTPDNMKAVRAFFEKDQEVDSPAAQDSEPTADTGEHKDDSAIVTDSSLKQNESPEAHKAREQEQGRTEDL